MRFISTKKHTKKELEEMRSESLFEELYASRADFEEEAVEEAAPEPEKKVLRKKEGSLTKIGKGLDKATGKLLYGLGKKITKAGSNMLLDSTQYLMEDGAEIQIPET